MGYASASHKLVLGRQQNLSSVASDASEHVKQLFKRFTAEALERILEHQWDPADSG
jgi:hypothetical protein